MEGVDLDRLQLPQMVTSAENDESMYTAFAVTVDLRAGTSTGGCGCRMGGVGVGVGVDMGVSGTGGAGPRGRLQQQTGGCRGPVTCQRGG